MMLYGIIYEALWYNICHAKDFRNISERLWRPQRKTLEDLAKDFRSISESLSHTNVYTTKRERLYHSPSSQEAHFGIKTTWFATQKMLQF